MGIQNVGDLSLGQWSAILTQWNAAHGDGKPAAPSEDEFNLAAMKAMGAA